jgi:hypothetical protein
MKSHDVRQMKVCPCRHFGHEREMIQVDGVWHHGRCAINKLGIEGFLALPTDQLRNMTLNDIGTANMKTLIVHFDKVEA